MPLPLRNQYLTEPEFEQQESLSHYPSDSAPLSAPSQAALPVAVLPVAAAASAVGFAAVAAASPHYVSQSEEIIFLAISNESTIRVKL